LTLLFGGANLAVSMGRSRYGRRPMEVAVLSALFTCIRRRIYGHLSPSLPAIRRWIEVHPSGALVWRRSGQH